MKEYRLEEWDEDLQYWRVMERFDDYQESYKKLQKFTNMKQYDTTYLRITCLRPVIYMKGKKEINEWKDND